VEIPEGVTRIHRQAFLQTFMRKIHIPSTVKFIGESAFVSCITVDTIIIDVIDPWDVEYVNGESGNGCCAQLPFRDVGSENRTKLPPVLVVPIGTESEYKTIPSFNNLDDYEPARSTKFTIVEAAPPTIGANDPKLHDLNVSEGKLDPTFSWEHIRYDVNVKNEIESIVISATAVAGDTVNADSIGKKNLVEGDNLFYIKVNDLATGYKESVYIINVHRDSRSANLKSLKIVVDGNPQQLSPPFHKDSTNYTVTGIETNKTIFINVTTEIAKATTDCPPSIIMPEGGTKLTIEVTPEVSGAATKKYNVTFDVTTGVLTAYGGALPVAPNPTSGVVNIDNPADDEVRVYSVGGTLLLRTRGTSVDLADYPTGVYIITVGDKAAKVVKH
jgi:hypothetical protein